jgi:hypothetical protein
MRMWCGGTRSPLDCVPSGSRDEHACGTRRSSTASTLRARLTRGLWGQRKVRRDQPRQDSGRIRQAAPRTLNTGLRSRAIIRKQVGHSRSAYHALHCQGIAKHGRVELLTPSDEVETWMSREIESKYREFKDQGAAISPDKLTVAVLASWTRAASRATSTSLR